MFHKGSLAAMDGLGVAHAMQAYKPGFCLQNLTNHYQAIETRDGKCVSCRASAEATVITEAPAALASIHASRRATREKALSSTGTSAVDAALAPRHALVPSRHRSKAGTQAAPMAAVQVAYPHSAKRSLLSRQASQDGVQQQQQPQQPVALPSSAVLDLHPPSQSLAVIPEAAEEYMAPEVPQDLQQDGAAGHASVKQNGSAIDPAAPADAVSAAASTGPHEALAAGNSPSAERVESLRVLASPSSMLSSHEQLKSLGELPSRTERQQRGSFFAPAALQEGMSAAAATPLSLLQLAATAAQHQLPSQGLASTHHHSAVQSAKHHHQSAVQPAASSKGSAAVNARQDASSSGADVLQGLQASLVQTVTSAVDSAMTQMR